MSDNLIKSWARKRCRIALPVRIQDDSCNFILGVHAGGLKCSLFSGDLIGWEGGHYEEGSLGNWEFRLQDEVEALGAADAGLGTGLSSAAPRSPEPSLLPAEASIILPPDCCRHLAALQAGP